MVGAPRRLSDRALLAFNAWFSSRAGVWHVLLATLLIVTIERLFPHLDDHGFWLLYWLTVWSAITQNALAYGGAESGRKLAAMQADHATLLRAIHDLTARQQTMLAAIQASETQEEADLARIERELAERSP